MSPIASKSNTKWERSIAIINAATSLGRKATTFYRSYQQFNKQTRRYPALVFNYMYFLRVLIGLMKCILCDYIQTRRKSQFRFLLTFSSHFFAKPGKTVLFLDVIGASTYCGNVIWPLGHSKLNQSNIFNPQNVQWNSLSKESFPSPKVWKPRLLTEILWMHVHL